MDELLHLETTLNIPSPLQRIEAWSTDSVNYFIKRDDLIDPFISGNKYRKLKGHLRHYLDHKQHYPDGLLTYGGAYSNHLYATASACQRLNIPLTAIVRGLEVDDNNPTLAYLINSGCKIIKISRTEYRLKDQSPTVTNIVNSGNYLVIPEGGNNHRAALGVKDLTDEIYDSMTPDYLCIMSGTGATAAGILDQMSDKPTKLIICSAVRDESVKQRILSQDQSNQVTWRDEQWGGFGKRSKDLTIAIDQTLTETGIPTEYVYTGRLMAHLGQLRSADYFPDGSRVVIIHTGGLRPSNHLAITRG